MVDFEKVCDCCSELLWRSVRLGVKGSGVLGGGELRDNSRGEAMLCKWYADD